MPSGPSAVPVRDSKLCLYLPRAHRSADILYYSSASAAAPSYEREKMPRGQCPPRSTPAAGRRSSKLEACSVRAMSCGAARRRRPAASAGAVLGGAWSMAMSMAMAVPQRGHVARPYSRTTPSGYTPARARRPASAQAVPPSLRPSSISIDSTTNQHPRALSKLALLTYLRQLQIPRYAQRRVDQVRQHPPLPFPPRAGVRAAHPDGRLCVLARNGVGTCG